MTEDEQIRRLLADARHPEPMPDDVAARLDGVLADLGADRPVRPGVTDLAAARRRRRARTLLLAAAAVVVAGVAVDQLRGAGTGGASDSAASDSGAGQLDGGGAGSSAEREAAGDADGAGQPSEQYAPEPSDSGLPATTDGVRPFEGGAFKLTPDDFGDQATRLQSRQADARSLDLDEARAFAASRCAVGEWGAGRVVVVRYDGSLGALVYRAPRGDTQVADLYLCGRDEPTRSITLPAP